MTVDRRGTWRTHRLSPGAHIYSKGDGQFPATAPRYLERGQGAYVWDDLGNRFLDWTMGLRTVTLGHGCAAVDDAAIEQMRSGSTIRRPSMIEAELTQELVDLIPGGEMVKFAQNGSTVTTAAIELARACTGRPYIAYCVDHPHYSNDGRFVETTAGGNGALPQAGSYSLPFAYNDLASLQTLFGAKPGEIAAVIMEPSTDTPPQDGFLEKVASQCKHEGALFILDERITGFRWHIRGGQTYFGVTPDLSTFGKGMANGYSVAALVGRRDVMELGGHTHNGSGVFLDSMMRDAENAPLAAARAVIALCRKEPVVDHLWRTGRHLIDGLNDAARGAGVGEHFEAYGFPCRPEYVCTEPGFEGPSLGLRTLFMQEMLRGGVLVSCISPSYAHGQREVEVTLAVARHAFQIYAHALEDGWGKYLKGKPIKPAIGVYN